jgi:hypothetical protein
VLINCPASQSLQSTSFLDTNKRLTDLQLNQIMDNLGSSRKLDPLKSLQLCYYAYRKSTASKRVELAQENPFWGHPKFNNWKSSKGTALVMVKGEYKTRQVMHSFAMNFVRLLRQSNIPVVWALKSPRGSGEESVSAVDVLKELICPLLQLNINLHTERSFSLSCAQFRAAQTPAQWFDLLATVLDQLPLLYIVIDIEAVSISYAKSTEGFSWLSSFYSLLGSLSERQSKTKVKVLLVSYGSASFQEPNLASFSDLVVFTRHLSRGASQKHERYVPPARRGKT